MNHKGTKTLETERLLLRQFKSGDASDMFENWASSEKDTRYKTWTTHHSVSDSKNIIQSWDAKKHKNKQYHWCIECKETQTAIGEINVTHIHKKINGMELEYCIGHDFKYQGYENEMLTAVVSFLINAVRVKRIEFGVDPEDMDTIEILTDFGFEREGQERQALHNNRGIVDRVIFSFLADDLKETSEE